MNRILNSKHWLCNIDGKEMELFVKLVSNIDKITVPNIKHLSNLFMFENNLYNVEKYFTEYNKLIPNEKRSRNEKNFIFFYGTKKGKEMYKEYILNISVSEKGFIRRQGTKKGKEMYKEYIGSLSKAAKERVNREGSLKQRERSCLCVEFWMKRGFDINESKEKVSNIQRDNSYKHHKKVMNKSYYKKINPICVEYWLNKGYSSEEAEINRQYLLEKCDMSLSSFIKRYGIEKGTLKYNNMKDKRRKTMARLISEGKINLYNGKASKESLKYFIPLRDILINKYNIDCDDMYFGYDDSKEYYIGNGSNYYYLYDFTIKSKKIIIEYNNIRWHPNPTLMSEDEWNEWYIYGMDAKKKFNHDVHKKMVAMKRGFSYFEIWNIYDYDTNMKNLINFLNREL